MKENREKSERNYSKEKDRKVFLYFSSNSFFKNNHYVNTLVNTRLTSAGKY